MQHQEVRIAADLVLQVGPLLPRCATIGGGVHPDPRRDVHLIGMQWIDHGAVHVVIHPWNHLEGASGVRALQEATLFDPDKYRVGVLGVEIDVFGMGDMGRSRKAPARHIHRS
jgi:hypothetical protein